MEGGWWGEAVGGVPCGEELCEFGPEGEELRLLFGAKLRPEEIFGLAHVIPVVGLAMLMIG